MTKERKQTALAFIVVYLEFQVTHDNGNKLKRNIQNITLASSEVLGYIAPGPCMLPHDTSRLFHIHKFLDEFVHEDDM